MSALADLKAGWDQAARENAMGNIVSSQPTWDPDEFFAYGRQEIDDVMVRLADLSVRRGNRRALDFGCGVGRLTQTLADYYGRVEGVDVSAEMLKLARTHNRHGKRVRYSVNDKRLRFPKGSFDLVYSMIVLQHMPQTLQRHYVREFFRVLRPVGVAVFQIPEGGSYSHSSPWLSMYGTDRAVVERWVSEAGGRVVDVDEAHAVRYTAVLV